MSFTIKTNKVSFHGYCLPGLQRQSSKESYNSIRRNTFSILGIPVVKVHILRSGTKTFLLALVQMKGHPAPTAPDVTSLASTNNPRNITAFHFAPTVEGTTGQHCPVAALQQQISFSGRSTPPPKSQHTLKTWSMPSISTPPYSPVPSMVKDDVKPPRSRIHTLPLGAWY